MTLKGIIKTYLMSLINILSVLFISLLINCYLKNNNLLCNELSYTLRIIATVLFAWVVIGKLGWGIQTWDGDSKIEKFDKYFFRSIYLIAFALLIISLK